MSNEITSNLSDFMLEQRASTERELIKKVWDDDNLKQELIDNPKAVLAREMGLESLPASINVQIIEEDESTLYVVIPKKPVEINESELEADEELSDEALESVAGGSNYVASGVSDVAQVWKTGLTASFLYGMNKMAEVRSMSQFSTFGRR